MRGRSRIQRGEGKYYWIETQEVKNAMEIRDERENRNKGENYGKQKDK